MSNNQTNLYVITGGPGVGKTTLINRLQQAGFLTVEEDARKIIMQQMAIGSDGLPWKNKELYAQLMFDSSLKSFQKVSRVKPDKPVFFDRGILDAVCYMRMENIGLSDTRLAILKEVNYNRNVFVLPPWKEIYHTDAERKQSWDEAVYTFRQMKETYLLYGYDVIEVPRVPLSERLQFITNKINHANDTEIRDVNRKDLLL